VRRGGRLWVLGSALLLGLSPGPAMAQGTDPEVCPSAPTADAPLEVERLVGKRVKRARELADGHGCRLRVVKRDGKDLIVTQDYRTDRVNIVVRDRRVTRVKGVG
jgi:hypothetical protein